MKKQIFEISLALVVLTFTVIFCVLIIPPLMENPDIMGAFGAGFVNPFSSGYSADVLCCYAILMIWVIWESNKVKHGWICLVLGFVPGVAVGFGLYLIMRTRQLGRKTES